MSKRQDAMGTKMRDTLLFRAFVFSLMINALASGAGMFGNIAKPLGFLGYLAQAIAAPPAFLIGWLIRPRTSSLIEIIGAGLEGLAFSIIFYTVLLWILLLLLNRSGQKNPG